MPEFEFVAVCMPVVAVCMLVVVTSVGSAPAHKLAVVATLNSVIVKPGWNIA